MKKKYIIGALALVMLIPFKASALEKSETVFVNTDATGNPLKTTVSSHLSFIGSKEIKDETLLENIMNTNGDENFKLSNRKLTWENKGNDIFYQGEINKKQPIKVEVKYYLDNEEKTISEMINKSGKVKIKITLKNTLKNTVKLNKKNETLYTPFVSMIGTVIDSDNNKDIKVSNGKVVSMGSRNIVIGLASPGMYDSLQLSDLKSLNSLTITYKTEKFTYNDLYIVSSPKILSDADMDVFDKMDDLNKNVKTLKKSMNTIIEGTTDLEDGASKLSKGSKTITTKLKTVEDSVKKLQDGSIALDKGLKQVLNGLDDTNKEIKKLGLADKVKELNKLKAANTDAINEISTGIMASIASTPLANSSIDDLIVLLKNGNISNASLASNLKLIVLLNTNNGAIDETISSLNSMSKKIVELVDSLDKGISKIEVNQKTLSDKLGQLKDGVKELRTGSKLISSNTEKLKDGIKKLNSGQKEFNEKGICVLEDYAKKAKNYSDKLEALVKLSKNYDGYASNNSLNTTFVVVVKNN